MSGWRTVTAVAAVLAVLGAVFVPGAGVSAQTPVEPSARDEGADAQSLQLGRQDIAGAPSEVSARSWFVASGEGVAVKVVVSWSAAVDVTDVTGYRVWRRSDAAAQFDAIGDAPADARQLEDFDVAPGRERYWYRVQALGTDAAPGALSAAVSVTTNWAPANSRPARPEGLSGARSADGDVRLTWENPTDYTVLGYRVWRRAGDGPWTVLAANTNRMHASLVDPGADTGTSYSYAVAAINARGVGPRSGSVTVAADRTTARPDVVESPLVARLGLLPHGSDDQNGSFKLALDFSDELAPGFGYRTLKHHAFSVEGGSVRKARRAQRGSHQSWTITVAPDAASERVVVTLPAHNDCGAAHAICARDGRALSNTVQAVIDDPAGLFRVSVSDSGGAVLRFDGSENRFELLRECRRDSAARAGRNDARHSGRWQWRGARAGSVSDVPGGRRRRGRAVQPR